MFNMNIMAKMECAELDDIDDGPWYTEEEWINQVSKVSGKRIDDVTRRLLQALFNEEGIVTIEQAARLI